MRDVVDTPISRLSQGWGPFRSEWLLFADRVEVVREGPLGRTRTPVELDRIDGFHLEEAPARPLALACGALLSAASVLLVLAVLGLVDAGLVLGVGGLGLMLGAGATALRRERVLVETIGGQRLALEGDQPSRDEVESFLRLLRRFRGDALEHPAPAWELALEEGLDAGLGDEWGELEAGDEGPIDPRWIN